MTIELAFQNVIATAEAVRAIIFHADTDGEEWEHVFPGFAPKESIPPYIVFRRADTERAETHGGPAGNTDATFLVTAWATTYDDASELAGLVAIVLDGTSGTWGDYAVGRSHVVNEIDEFEPSPELVVRQYHGRQLTVEISFTDTD